MRNHVLPPITKRMISMASPVTGQKDNPRSAGSRGGDPGGGYTLYGGKIRAKSKLSAHGSKIAVPGGGGLTPSLPRKAPVPFPLQPTHADFARATEA